MVEVIHILDTMDNPHWEYNQDFVEDTLQRVHNLEPMVDSGTLEASNPEADIQGKVGMVDTLVGREVLQRDARPASRTHVLDKSFGDQQAHLALHRCQDDLASQWEHQPPLVF
jgi:hypothetical protein